MKFLAHALVALALATTSCSKDGDVGPMGPQGSEGEQGLVGAQGPQGEQGAKGDPGENGEDGADGEDGNANVFFSDQFFPNWNGADTPRFKRMTITDSRFSQVINGDGAVAFVYWSTNNGTTFPLPWNSYNASGNITISRSYVLRGNDELWISIRKFGSDFEDTETVGKVGLVIYNQLRYIVVPSETLAAKSSLDYSDYEAVRAYYGISP